ncbi:hypothetical protein [Spiroplasma phoeniceum]|uniref:Uncharacterized protein n=1 Tax=Spiroplasma phoeniceum P40 TaxID=1276259 RepID=A0A345DN76_9MOLU|nr:hypothetical protein [Spiroplasma phoeniceum]AXF95664.1 hypothetical protein SDAV_00675 [Spiroplasma phoeniceum P40]
MINAKIVDVKDIPKLIKPENYFLVQARWVKYGNAYFEGSQRFALTWYYENNSYYIQVLTQHWVNVTGSSIGGGTWMGIGTGIRLYND